MKLLYRCCAGLDIHRDTVSACIRKRVRGQAEPVIEEQVFGTFTQELEGLRSWLKQHKVKQVAMESTGVYWIPVWNILERSFTLTLVNPATVRALQGQKTDRIDARRIAEYLQYGLLRGSFIPGKPIRQLRELTRMRVHIQQDRNRVINRIARLLETVNLKLASVASNIVGASGLAMLRLLASGVCDPEKLADCAQSSLRVKIPALILALDGRPDAHFCWMLSQLLIKLDRLDQERGGVDARLDSLAGPYEDVLRRLSTIPGVDRTSALVLLAEFGEDMSQFPTAAHLASWAGLCPGNAESAGKLLRTHAQRRPLCAAHSGPERLGGVALPRLFSGCVILPHRTTAGIKKGRRGRGAPYPHRRLAYSGSAGCRVSRARRRFLRPPQSRAHCAQAVAPPGGHRLQGHARRPAQAIRNPAHAAAIKPSRSVHRCFPMREMRPLGHAPMHLPR